MSFACRPNAGAVNFIGTYNGASVAVARPTQATNAQLTFNADGTVTYTVGAGIDSSSGLPASWYLPTLSGVGSSYTVKLTVNSGTTPTGTVGSFVSFPQTWGLSTAIGVLKSGIYTVAIADATGSFVYETGTVSMTSDST